MRTSALFGAKHIRFFEIYGVFARTREEGLPVRIFCGQGKMRGQFFTILCERPLWTAPKILQFFSILTLEVAFE